MVDMFKQPLLEAGCFKDEYPAILKIGMDTVATNAPERMKALMVMTELMVFASNLRKPIMWEGSTIPVNTISFIIAGCVDADTEFLTPTGWKRIADYTAGDKVLTWEEDLSTSFVTPDKYINQPTKGLYNYSNKYLDMTISDSHNVALLTKYDKRRPQLPVKFKKHTGADIRTGVYGKANSSLPFNFNAPSRAGIDITDDELRLHIAFVADGSIQNASRDTASPLVRIRVKHEYKKIRLRKLLKSVYGEVDERVTQSEPDYSRFYFKPPITSHKTFDNLWEANLNQLQVISDEVTKWDGGFDTRSNNSNIFRTTKKAEADFIQYVWRCVYDQHVSITTSTRDGKSSVDYVVRKTAFDTLSFNTDTLSITKLEDTTEYCFTMPNGNWVARKGSTIFLTHNSGIGKDSSMQGIRKALIPAYEKIDKYRIQHAKQAAIEAAELDGKKPTDWHKYYSKPRDLFSGIGTLPGQMKHLAALEAGKLGAGYIQVSELGSELQSNKDIAENIVALAIGYDAGYIPAKTLKNDAEQTEPIKNLPFNGLMFGSPDNIIFDEVVKAKFKEEFSTKLSRRSWFNYVRGKVVREQYSSTEEFFTAKRQVKEDARAAMTKLEPWLTHLVDATNQKPLIVNNKVEDLFEAYKAHNEIFSDTMSKQHPMSILHRQHMQWKALKLAGALAILENSETIEASHYVDAINFTEIFANDLEAFEVELAKEPYELFADYMLSIAENGYANMSIHKLRKMGFIKGNGIAKNKMLELIDLARSYDDQNKYQYADNYIHFYEGVIDDTSERDELM